jgi:urease accessory protein
MMCPHGRLQRAAGRMHLAVRRTQAGTAIANLHQAGCLNVRFPRTHGTGMEAVLINLSGGVADGDALTIGLEAGDGSKLTLSTPSAERIYRAMPGAQAARVATRITIGAGARLNYLPQETLLFDGCALDRSIDIDIDAHGIFLGVEARIFGRALSGETITALRLHDRITLRRAGRPALQDCLRLQGDVRTILADPAGAGGCKAAATIVYAAADAATFLTPIREVLNSAEAGASAWNGLLIARIVAQDGQALRRALLPALKILAATPLPRLWAS